MIETSYLWLDPQECPTQEMQLDLIRTEQVVNETTSSGPVREHCGRLGLGTPRDKKQPLGM
jgi:hypothetical protein